MVGIVFFSATWDKNIVLPSVRVRYDCWHLGYGTTTVLYGLVTADALLIDDMYYGGKQ